MKISKNYHQDFAQFQTEAASPSKHSQGYFNKKYQPSLSQLPTQVQTAFHSKKISKTEEQIYSHPLISSIMNKRHNNSVSHTIGHFDPDMQLYAKPKNPEEYGMLQFSDQRQMYQSQYTKKIIDINGKLNKGQSLTERLKCRKNVDNQTFYKTKRPSSAQPKTTKNEHKKISVSGLVSYNFNSVNARKNLGFDLQRDDDKLSNILQKLNQKNKCCTGRQCSLIQKKKLQKARRDKQVKQAIFSDFESKTNNFLNNLHEQITQQKIIYGMKWGKLLCIKQLIQQQQITFTQAQQIVNQIQQKKIKIVEKENISKLQRDDEKQLNNRRQVVQKNRIIVKQLYFID